MPKKENVPAIRFKDFTDAWEQRRLKEIADKVTEKNVKLQFKETFTNSAEFGIISQRDYFDHDISNEDNLGSYYVVKNEDFVYNPRISTFAPVGPINRNKLGRNGVMSPLYTVFRTHDINNTFLEQYYRSIYWHSFMKLNGDSGARSDRFSIKDSVLIEMPIPYPGLKEQLKIGEYLTNLDNLITLQQRKLLKLKNVKKAMIEKMFPKNGSNVPEIRFAGFTDAWEQRKFSETFIYLQNNALSRAELNYEQGLVKNVHYGDVLIKFGEILDVKKADIPFISNNEFNVSSTSLLQNGDVIIADAAEDETVGKCSEIKGIDGISIVSGLHTIPCRPNKKFASGYLGYYLNSSVYHDQLLPLIQGTKISSVSKSALQNTGILYPDSEQEQLQIGEYFRHLDNLITLHQRKYEKLQNLKKACLEKMFV